MEEVDGELRTITVLFADMTASVATFHGVDPEATTDRVNEVLDAMVASVHAYGGTVDRFLGDGLLALFGTPEAHEDDPVRAVSAGLDLCQRVEALGVAATAGVSTGAVYVGQVGSAEHRETTAIGPVVNLAARLQGRARAGEVVIASSTARHCAGAFALEAREFDIKGIPDAVPGFVVTGRQERPVHRPTAAARTPLVGRDDELELIRAATSALARGEGGIVLIVADAGLGKSRLLDEVEPLVPEDAVVLEGRCVESGAAPLGPFADALHGHLRWDPATPDSARRSDVERLVELAVSDAADGYGDQLVRPALRALAGVGAARDEGWEDLPPQQRQRETFRAVRQLISGFARRQRVVLVLEDLHWADPASVSLAADLFSLALHLPLLVICTYRPAREHPCWRLSADADARCPERTTRIALRELDDRACDEMVARMLGIEAVPEALRPAVLDRAQGNPLFVEEFVRAGIETGWLREQDGAWALDTSAAAPHVPDTLELIVRARTDRLAPAVRRVLQLASLQGRIFSSAVLAELEDRAVVASALEALEERDLVHPARGRGPDEYAFKHVLVQETIEQGVLRRVKPDMHRRILDALERIHASRLDEHAAQLAHHAQEAKDAVRAVRHLVAAGLNAKASHLNDEADRLLTQAIAWCDQSGATDHQRAQIREHRGDVAHRSGRHGDAIGDYDDALVVSGDALDRARLHRKVGGVAVIQRQYDDASARFEAAQAELGPVHPEPGPRLTEWIDMHLARAGLYYWRNEPEAMGAALDAVRDVIDQYGSDTQRSEALQTMMMRELRETRYLVSPTVIDIAERSAELASRRADPGFRAFKRFNLAFTRLWARDLHAALQDFASSIEDGERAGDVVVLSRCHTYRSVAHRLLLDEAGCEADTTATERVAREGEMVEYLAAALGNRAWLARRRGDAAGVRRHAEDAIDAWQSTSLVYGFQWIARFPLLAVALSDGDTETIDDQLEWLRSPSQQRLPEPVEAPLLAGDVSGAVAVATELGYA